MQTAQVTATRERDLDSSPNNMSGAAKEDDEVGYLAQSSLVNNGFPEIRTSPSVLTVSPNPAQNEINVSINNSEQTDWSIRILNPVGQVVYTRNGQNNSLLEIDVKDFQSGIYIVEYQINGEKRVEKVLVQH